MRLMLPSIWLPQWDVILWQPEIPLERRLAGFYREFALWLNAAFSCDKVELCDEAENGQWMHLTETRLIEPLAMEMRKLCGRYRCDMPPGSEEKMAIWGLHGQVIFSVWLANQKEGISENAAERLAITLTGIFCRGAPAMFSAISDRMFPR
ncbi:hypothetical protein RSA31_07505 [Pantoea dispersa]|uniref:hypothetical protein n=1 Tax=Pantoea dispersa TaxID=59814 RepID=UPI0007369A2A|nr:hypothetical protein [Pantoea dispersa]KTS14506.1 hypothetical protein NS215_21820 [Pantoea dispersa]KTS88974.1 hypothetical protein RSA31_07505 [Pantoea dispersa]